MGRSAPEPACARAHRTARGRRPTGALTAVSPSGVGAAESGPGPWLGRQGPAWWPGPPGAARVAVVLAPLAGAGTTVSGRLAVTRSQLRPGHDLSSGRRTGW